MRQEQVSDLLLSGYVNAPSYVQTFIQSGGLESFLLEIQKKYALHVDVLGTLSDETLMMLLGYSTPSEFAENLKKESSLSENLPSILEDMNSGIFIPLRDQAKTPNSETELKKTAISPQLPVMGVGNREEVPANLPGQNTPTAPVSPNLSINREVKPTNVPPSVPVSAPSSPSVQTPAYTSPPLNIHDQLHVPAPIYSNPTPAAPPVETYQPATRTMAHDMELAAQGQQGQAAQPVFQSAPVPVQYAPVPAPIVPSAQPFVPPPQAAPTPEPLQPNYSSPATAPVRLTPVDRVHTNAPITKEYGSDPYRESIE